MQSPAVGLHLCKQGWGANTKAAKAVAPWATGIDWAAQPNAPAAVPRWACLQTLTENNSEFTKLHVVKAHLVWRSQHIAAQTSGTTILTMATNWTTQTIVSSQPGTPTWHSRVLIPVPTDLEENTTQRRRGGPKHRNWSRCQSRLKSLNGSVDPKSESPMQNVLEHSYCINAIRAVSWRKILRILLCVKNLFDSVKNYFRWKLMSDISIPSDIAWYKSTCILPRRQQS